MKATKKLRKLTTTMCAIAMLCSVPSTVAFAAEVDETKTANMIADNTIGTSEEAAEQKETEQETTKKEVEKELDKKTEEESAAKTTKLKETSKKVSKTTTKTNRTSATKTSTTKTQAKKASYTAQELKLLSCIIYCESGNQSYTGKLLVGSVVNNRKNSKLFPNNIKDVIYQRGQFGPARNGTLARALREYETGKFTSANEKESIKAAKAVLNGTKTTTYHNKTINLTNYLYFSGRVSGYKLQVGGHQFK